MLAVAICGCLDASSVALAQPPGTEPPADVIAEPGARGESDAASGLPIKAFMFLSEAESPVLMPGMSWEELERLQNLDIGTEAPTQAYSYQSLEITGTAADQRADLEVTLRLSIESTDNDWIAIPLRMGNFHRLAPPDVTGVEEYFMTLSRGGTGYLLWVKTNNRRDATLRMNVSARVETTSTRALDFQLPDVPSTVRLIASAENVTGDVVGRGYETIEAKKLAGGRTEFVVESGGGTFTVRWGRLERKSDDAPSLEVVSRINLIWESPQDAPRATVQLTLRNDRNSIDSFEIRLPTGSIVSEGATLGAGGQSITFGPPLSGPDGDRRQVLIPEEERQNRIDLIFSFNVQLPSGNVSSTNPVAFRVPEVIGTLRHRGEITVQTSDEYRLRWHAEPWVRSVLADAGDATATGRSYLFQFDRGSFELPLWLSAKERQVRINAKSTITFRETTATLEMLIRASGRAADGRGPQIDMAGWTLQAIENDETDEPMDSFQGDDYPEIDFPSGSGEPPPIRIRAQYTIDPTQELIVISVPRIVRADDSLLVPTSTVDVVSSGRSLLVVDLEASENLERIVSPASETASGSTISSFRIDSYESPAVIVGTMVEQPPRITLASDGTIALDANQLHTTIDWTVTSRLDLEGRLPIRIPMTGAPIPKVGAAVPKVGAAGAKLEAAGAKLEAAGAKLEALAAQRDDPAEPPSESLLESAIGLLSSDQLGQHSSDAITNWGVTVNGVPAVLQQVGVDRFDLVSDRLADGTMSIRWDRTQVLSSAVIGDSIESVALPRLAIEDVPVRGAVRISLRGDHQTELLSAVSPSVSELLFDSLPPEPVRLRLRSRETPREELSVSQVVLRTVIGRSTRHEQVLANIQGGESFRVGLPTGTSEVSVEAEIDRKPWPVRRDGDTLILSLPGDQSSHVVDLRVWIAETSASTVSMIEPMLRLPVGVGRVYWQIIAPHDSHVIWASPTIGRSMTWNFALEIGA